MARRRAFRVLVATDGSPAAQAAVSTATSFPWPEGVQLSGVLAEHAYAGRALGSSLVMTAFGQSAQAAALKASGALAKRWPEARVAVVRGLPVDAILREAKRLEADVIVTGWRGHGAFRRLLAGSVSRGVVRQAGCAVLVVRRTARDAQRIVIGFDGSLHARRAVALVARLAPPRGGRVTLLTAVEVIRDAPSHALATHRMRAVVAAHGRRINRERVAAARRALERPARALATAGWKVDPTVTTGSPLDDLLEAVGDARARVLAVGARGAGGIEHLLVGSVAQGALDRSSVPVLIAR